jgi:hypothetical protein
VAASFNEPDPGDRDAGTDLRAASFPPGQRSQGTGEASPEMIARYPRAAVALMGQLADRDWAQPVEPGPTPETRDDQHPQHPTCEHRNDRDAAFPGMEVTQAWVIASEWTKFRSLRSTLITLLVRVLLTIGLGTLISAVTASRCLPPPPMTGPASMPSSPASMASTSPNSPSVYWACC